MLLLIMVKHNPSNKIEKKLNLFYVYHSGLEYVCTKIVFIIVYNVISLY